MNFCQRNKWTLIVIGVILFLGALGFLDVHHTVHKKYGSSSPTPLTYDIEDTYYQQSF